jgi:tetratricopeptide (TPR) repeat protein
MKRSILLLAAVGLSHVAGAQSPIQAPDVRAIYNSPTWQKAMAGYYGVDSDIAPKPETADISQIQIVAPLLGEPSTMEAGAQQLDQYRKGLPDGTNYSPVIDQIIGAVYFQLGTLSENEAQQSRYYRLAIQNLELAISKFPNYRQAHKNLANLYFKSGDSAKAKKHFVRALELGDKDSITYGILAAIYYEDEQFSAAETAARNSIMINPKEIQFRRILGLTLFQQERFAEARAVFEELLQEKPNDAFFWQMISNTLINEEKVDEAARILEIVRFMDKADVQTLLLLGDVYMNKDMTEDAAEAYGDALDLVPSMREDSRPIVQTFVRPVQTLNNYQAYDLAIDLLDKINEVYPNVPQETSFNLLALRSQINLSRNRAEEAARNLQTILDADPMNGRALLSLAEYYGYRRQAPADATNAQQKQFDAESLQRALDLYDRAQELISNGTDEGREFARQAYIGSGQLLARKRRLDEALADLRAAQRIQEEPRITDYIQMIEAVQNPR